MFRFDIFERVLRLNIGVSQDANREMFDLLCNILPLQLKQYDSGREHNGWVVPHDWGVRRAEIRRNGEVVFDGCQHPMAVAGYSASFRGTVSRSELEGHVFYREALPDAYAFHCMNNYRPWAQNWGFCVPYSSWRTWPQGDYEVELETEYRQGHMLVGEYHHQGASDQTVVFNAHTCHPCQFNDDLSGVAVLLQLFRWLRGRTTRYSYRLVLGPEHLGTVFYLADLPESERAQLKVGAFVEMVGIDEPLVLQRSFNGTSILDRVTEFELRQKNPELKVGAFRTVVGNDETVWEAPGIEIPFISISRCFRSSYYPQYHTSEDNLEIASEERLAEALVALQETIGTLEEDCTIRRQFTGLVALSNPKYDLYVEREDPTVPKQLSAFDVRMGSVQDALPRYFDGRFSVFEIAERFNIPFAVCLAYLRKFEAKGLVRLNGVTGFEHYDKVD